MYILLIIATILFSTQFLMHQNFTKSKGDGLLSALTFSVYTHFVSFFVMISLNGFNFRITLFSLMIGLWSAVNSILYSYFGVKALTKANLSVYSIFAMLGGLILPSLAGVVFFKEELTLFKILCCFLIVISLLLTVEKEKEAKKTTLLYLAVFILNGMCGVISKIHQSNTAFSTDSYSFVAIGNMLTFAICILWYLLKYKKLPLINAKEFAYTSGYAVSSGIGNLFMLIALTVLPASVQYPIVTGGCIFFSTVVSFILGQKPTVKNILSAVIAFISTVLIIL